ncbi:MAG: discoidin domain-containing protein [Gemmatimonadaceae bacterium]
MSAISAAAPLAMLVLSAFCAPLPLHAQTPHRATVTIDTAAPIASFDPLTALGSTIDGHVRGATAQIFTPANVAAMKSAEFHTVSYRIRTELGVEAWHWNPQGRWSDAAHRQGYWTSSDRARGPITVSYGYRLPRRGSTIDQANEDGYSRLDDGDARTFWKSNPYLDQQYTGEPDEQHPQWVVIDLKTVKSVDAIRIRWGIPFATSYDVQFWDGEQPDDADDDNGGTWHTFENGAIRSGVNARGGDVTLPLAAIPALTRWVRLLLHTSSGRAPAGSSDIRDGLGYAIRELSIGRIEHGTFRDLIKHAPTASEQTRVYASSTDPWHRAADRDTGTEQPGIDLMFSSGITRRLPMLLPVGVLYDTPDNAAALLSYVRWRHYSVPRVELGEEPDGQYVSPDDFAALYVQAAGALHGVDPEVRLGGPSLQSAEPGVMMTWKQKDDTLPWLGHFIHALRAHNRIARDFSFLSFEWYPFDDVCGPTGPQLASVAAQLAHALQQFTRDGLPVGIPVLMTEYGYSAFPGSPEVELAGAIMNSESVAEFLALGGSTAFFYGTEPSSLDSNHKCNSWGDNTLFLSDDARHIRAPTATYHAARLLTTAWTDASGGMHTMLRTAANADDASAIELPIAAYTLRRPDTRIAVLLLNRDPTNSWDVQLRGSNDLLHSALDLWQLSSAEYSWHPRGASGYAAPNVGPRHALISAGSTLHLPPYSVTVVRQL